LALSLFASPVMACLVADSALTDEERECCRQMAGNCDQMPASHSCCQTTVRDSGPYLNNSRPAVSAPALIPLAVLPLHKAFRLPDSTSQSVGGADAHAPPASPLVKTSILRI
jgi:hypothetical protein